MNLEQIKIELYKQKKTAKVTSMIDGVKNYSTKLNDGTDINFSVPKTDMGVLMFEDELPAQLLNRWIVY